MVKWEYCEVHTVYHEKKTKVYYYTPQGSILQEYDSHMSKQGLRDGEEFDRDIHVMVIAQLGLDGWEAYAVNAGRMYFKRLFED